MKIAELPQRKTYEPFGRCVYCGDDACKLTREHIIPFSLGGEVILPEASCEQCQKEVKKYEAQILNYTFIQARTFLELPMQDPSRRPRDLRLGRFQGDEEWPDLTDNFSWERVPVEDHPASIMLPVFEKPRLLSGQPPTEKFQMVGQSVHILNGPPPQSVTQDGKRQANFIQFSPDNLCKFLAKIAHGSACAILAADQFSPLLGGIIRNADPHISALVGSDEIRAWPRRKALHHVELRLTRGLVLAHVQLFARYGLNPFIVIVGTATEALRDRLQMRS